uniref:FMN-binding protein n=1 Tax=Adlercreutzia equolifaciens TaxID=446660 RepID=UPI003AF5BAE5
MYEIPQLSRRSFIRNTTIAGIGVAVLGLAGCTPDKPTTSSDTALPYTAGTYTASSQGKFGPVTIQATFSNEAIENIEVTDHEETAFISN